MNQLNKLDFRGNFGYGKRVKSVLEAPALTLTKPTLSEVRMADKHLCSIPDCGKTAHIHGWCSAHYHRWIRHGDPLGGKPTPGFREKFIRDVVIPYNGTGCLIWPFAKQSSGHAQTSWNGKRASAHRVICEIVNGPPPTPNHEAAHSCGKGHLGCVTPAHLRWKTHAENMAEMVTHGTSVKGGKNWSALLTEGDIPFIRSLKGVERQSDIAKRYGVHPTTISQIWRGKSWGWVE